MVLIIKENNCAFILQTPTEKLPGFVLLNNFAGDEYPMLKSFNS